MTRPAGSSYRHETRAGGVAAAMRSAVRRMPEEAAGAVWAIASGPRDDRRVTVDAAGPLGTDALFLVASVTKVLTAALVHALADDGVLGLDDRLEQHVREWVGRRVLREPYGPLAATVPADRSFTVRDLLTMGLGLGYDLGAPDGDPLTDACQSAGLMSSWVPPAVPPREWAATVGRLPARHQPGAGWLYQSSFDALTVVVERASGAPFDSVLRDRLLRPLGMADTGYTVPSASLSRVPTHRFPTEGGGTAIAIDDADPRLAQPPTFASGATGLVSTARDLISFGQLLLDGGVAPAAGDVAASVGPGAGDGVGAPGAGAGSRAVAPGAGGGVGAPGAGAGSRAVAPEAGGGVVRLLPAAAVRAMATDALGELPGPVRAAAGPFLSEGRSWSLGCGVDADGRFGWDGGTGSSLWVDPAADVVGVLLTRYGMSGAEGLPDHMAGFWRAVRAAPWR